MSTNWVKLIEIMWKKWTAELLADTKKQAALKMTPNYPDAKKDVYGFSKSSSMPWMSRI